MSMTGAIVNALAIVAGGAVGLLFQRGIPERVSKTVMIGLGLCVLYIGISGAFACRSILIVIVSMTLGAAEMPIYSTHSPRPIMTVLLTRSGMPR